MVWGGVVCREMAGEDSGGRACRAASGFTGEPGGGVWRERCREGKCCEVAGGCSGCSDWTAGGAVRRAAADSSGGGDGGCGGQRGEGGYGWGAGCGGRAGERGSGY